MTRIIAVILGMFVGGGAVMSLCGFLMQDSLEMSDGLAPGMAWLYLIFLTGVGSIVGGAVGFLLEPRFSNRLREELKPPHERQDEQSKVVGDE